jgi:tRNA A-37 threonylcarbamoyl transferase component Bud32/tetratricopeptide (TPR) repeat protein
MRFKRYPDLLIFFIALFSISIMGESDRCPIETGPDFYLKPDCLDIVNCYLADEMNKAKKTEKKGVIDSKTTETSFQQATVLRNQAIEFITLNNFAEAEKSGLEAMKQFVWMQDHKNQSFMCVVIGITKMFQKEINQTLFYFLEALKVAESFNLATEKILSLIQIGLLHQRFNNHDTALSSLCQVEKFQVTNSSSLVSANLLYLIGRIYFQKKQWSLAMDYFKGSIKQIESFPSSSHLPQTLIVMGIIDFNQNQFHQALKYFMQGLKIAAEKKDSINEFYAQFFIGKTFIQLGQQDSALKYFLTAEKIAAANDTLYHIELIKCSLANYYLNKGFFVEALVYLKEFRDVSFENHRHLLLEKSQTIQTLYELNLFEENIRQMQRQDELQSMQRWQQKKIHYVFIVIAFLFVLIIIQLFRRYSFLFWYWKNKNQVGHYQILEKIASGGIGTVYKAVDMLNKNNPVAVKILRDEYQDNEDHIRRFHQEAAIINKLDHPNIIRILDRGVADNTVYIVMELLDGMNLADLISSENMNLSIITNIFQQITSALASMHEKSIIHRDLKPENIMIVNTINNPYHVKLLDFGLARQTAVSNLAQTGNAMGTIFYMSPEQVMDLPLTASADMYSLGVILYEMLSGQKPFYGETSVEVIHQIIHKESIPLRVLRPDIPLALLKIVENLMDKKPENRISSEKLHQILRKYKIR